MADEIKNPFELPPVPENERPVAYWLGTLPGCPMFNVAAGGIQFHRYTDPPVGYDPDSMATQRSYNKGSVEYLTPTMVSAIHSNIKDKVVRFFGTQGQGQIHSLGSPTFERSAQDQPLAMFLYMTPLDEASTAMRHSPKGGYPNSLYTMSGGKGAPVMPKAKNLVPDVAPEIEDLDKPEAAQHVPPQLTSKKNR
jgi:hypothetical protein